nr:MAG TPA: hypothetical protein [Caudoviricetes sp.]
MSCEKKSQITANKISKMKANENKKRLVKKI